MKLNTLASVVVLTTFALSSILGEKVASSQKTTCSLYIRTDPTLWQYVRQRIPNHQDYTQYGEVDRKTRYEIINIVSRHVAALNDMFTHTKFDGRFEHRNYKFQLQKLKIDTVNDCYPLAVSPSPYCDGIFNASVLLNKFAAQNNEDYCLAYLFTYRDFYDDRLGRAYVGQPVPDAGGICTKQKTVIHIGRNGENKVRKLSLNTGFITLLNNGKQLPDSVSHYNFARHVGYSFGAQYENDIRKCYENEPNCKGYLMARRLQLGDNDYTRFFSAASIEKISAVLDAIKSGINRNCFTASTDSFCGNYILEEGEECDCGFDDVECYDRCCYPRSVSLFDLDKNATAKGCTRRALTQCSPSQGPCCHEGRCELIPSYTNTTCKEADECHQQSFCNGLSTECPMANPVPDSTCDLNE